MFAEKFNGQLLSTSFENNGISGYIIIPKNMGDISNDIYINIKTGELADKIYQYLNYIIPGLFMIAFAIIMYILLKQKSSAYEIVKRCYRKYKKIPICCKIILLFFAIEYFNENHSLDIWYDYYAMQMNNIVGDIIRLLIYFLVFTAFFISVFFSIIYIINMILKPSELKNEYEIKIIYDISRDTKYILNTRNYSLFVLYMFLIAGTAVSIFLFIMVLRYLGYFNLIDLCGIIILEFSGLIIVYKIMKLILSYCKLSYCMENMVKGNVENISEKSKAFKKPFEDLQKINDDIKEKIEEMMKNERLKTELITNVSHDLKTPLTSVINYIDLLKEEKIDNDSAKDYIHIIDDKAQRLKNLIDDLFEASKLSAKQFKLDIAKSDVIALLKQTLGEINHKIEKSDINFVIELPNKPIYLNIDGQQIWRVFNNLLNNIIKYSPQNSRAYISLEENESDVKIIMKNVSKVPLNFNANELFERFKRGDKARSTEGSGLGLSIAKSIIELHGGEINVQIDGDLFKAVVVLRKNINDDQN